MKKIKYLLGKKNSEKDLKTEDVDFQVISNKDQLLQSYFGAINEGCNNPSCSGGSNNGCTNTGCTGGTNRGCINEK